MMKPNNLVKPNHPAFCIEWGLTKREYFAAFAMEGLISMGTSNIVEPDGKNLCESAAKRSLQYADALIAELNKPHV